MEMKMFTETQGLLDTKMDDSCVIVLGNVGQGKSTLLNLCTGNTADASDSRKSVTLTNKIYKDKIHGKNYPKWMDTVGLNEAIWEDEEPTEARKEKKKKDTIEIFQSFLRELKKEKVKSVRAIIWMFSPATRETAEIQEQVSNMKALFEGIEETRKPTSIWNNMILVCRGAFNEFDFQGARSIIDHNVGASVNLSCIKMENFGRNEKDEVDFESENASKTRDMVMEALMKIQQPISINFKTMVCRDCGQKDDPRLMSIYCHLGPTSKYGRNPSPKTPPVLCGNCCPPLFSPGKYIRYLWTKNEKFCANPNCTIDIKGRKQRSEWTKKNCWGDWRYTGGIAKDGRNNRDTCSVVKFLGKFEVTGNREGMAGREPKKGDRHNLAEIKEQ